MSGEAPVLGGVAKAAAGDVEAANFVGNGGDDEDGDERGQDRQSPKKKTVGDEREPAKNFQPRQIKCEADANCPWQNFVIVDVIGETDRIERFNRTGVNENAADDKFRDPPGESRND